MKIKEDNIDNEILRDSLAPYNEYNHAGKGGYYNCPYCGCQLYVAVTEDGQTETCDNCNKEHVFVD